MIAIQVCFPGRALCHEEEHLLGVSLRDSLLSTFAPWITAPVFGKREGGKPYIVDSPIEYSVTHTDGCVMCAVSVPGAEASDVPCLPEQVTCDGVYLVDAGDFSDIGCDCQRVDRSKSEEWILRLSGRFFTEAERRRLSAASDVHCGFFELWSAKEALIKCTGEGLSGVGRDTEAPGDDFRIIRFTAQCGGEAYCSAICLRLAKQLL